MLGLLRPRYPKHRHGARRAHHALLDQFELLAVCVRSQLRPAPFQAYPIPCCDRRQMGVPPSSADIRRHDPGIRAGKAARADGGVLWVWRGGVAPPGRPDLASTAACGCIERYLRYRRE